MQGHDPAAIADEAIHLLRLLVGGHHVAGIEDQAGTFVENLQTRIIHGAAGPDAFILRHRLEQLQAGKIKIMIFAAGDDVDMFCICHEEPQRSPCRGKSPLR